MLGEVQQATERWLHLWGGVSRGDVLRLSNQVASLERQVRELRREAEERPHPLLNGHRAGGSRARSGRARPAPRTPSVRNPAGRGDGTTSGSSRIPARPQSSGKPADARSSG
jgi:hypothetical protein